MYSRQSLYLCFPRLLSVLFFSLSNAAAAPPILSLPSGGYLHHDPHLNDSRHYLEFFTFLSRPDITHAPRWDIHVYDKSRIAPGHWLVAPYASFIEDVPGPSWTATYIYNADGDLIWYGGYLTGSWTVSDFRVSGVLGQQMLSFVHHHESSAFLIDETYNIHRKVALTYSETEAVNGHEFALVDNGTRALYFFNQDGDATREDSAKIGFEGNCSIRYHGFRELDARSWKPVFSWAEADHISLDETYATQESEIIHCTRPDDKPFDYTHLNAIHKFPDGDYLVSSRRTFALYKVSHKDGSIIWRLGGKKSDFQLDTAWTGQHGARVISQNSSTIILSFLDNAKYTHSIPATHGNSRALFLALHNTERPMRAETILSIEQPDGEYNMARGNVQVLPNGNIRPSWVTGCLFSEHDKDGNILMRARLKPDFTTYRSYKFEWKGMPSVPPDVHAAAVVKNWKVGVVVHVSWNGATEVKRWRLWHSDADGRLLQVMAETNWQGFESSMQSDIFAKYVVVEAFDGNDRKLGQSQVIETIVPGELVNTAEAAEQEWRKENAVDESALSATTHKAYETVQNPVVQLAGGVIIAIGILVLAVWIVLHRSTWRNHVVWRSSTEKAYEPVLVNEI